ncbi:MAG TPA: formate/nitrite transporter family protein [Acidimicrobiia bacterium]|jgi:formate/nitrite transporter FocA (FNT family)
MPDTDTEPETGAANPLADTLARSVDEGERRLARTWPSLLATGTVGGIDVGIGLLAMLVVRQQTGSPLLGALAFGIGFVALTLAGSELFTENFMIPLTAFVTRDVPFRSVLRLWVGTAVTNLLGGWVITGLVMTALPDLNHTAVQIGSVYPSWGIGRQSFAAGVLGGVVITLLTWMERSTESVPARLVAAVAIAFTLTAPPLNHAVVSSLEMFAALHAGAPFSYLDWAGAAAWAALANAVGGVVFVTMLRLLQIGRGPIIEERERADSNDNS